MKPHFKYALPLIVICLLVLLTPTPQRRGILKHETVAASQSTAPATPERVQPASPKFQDEAMPLRNYLMAEHPAAIERRIEERDAFISRYRLLGQRKVLLDENERDELAAMLRDEPKRSLYTDYLKTQDFSQESLADEQMYRLFLVQYLEAAWLDTKDPGLLAFLISFVLSDNFSPELPLQARKVLAYEKIKLLSFFKANSPEALTAVEQRMTGLRHEKLLRSSLLAI